jgi:hypothetical protein
MVSIFGAMGSGGCVKYVLGHEGGVEEVDGVHTGTCCLRGLGGAHYDEDAAAEK